MRKHFLLVIEDDSATGEMIKLVLSDEGYNVLVISQCDRALKFLATQIKPEDVNAIILDLHFTNGMNGEECLRRIKEEGSIHKAVPVIVSTAKPISDNDIAELTPHVFDFLEKPFSIVTLIEIVGRAVSNQ